MDKYNKDFIYVSAYAKLPMEMPSAELYKSLDVGLVIHKRTGEIIDASITLVTGETKEFIKSILIGKSMKGEGVDMIVEEIRNRYFGSSQKAICVIMQLIHEKYMRITTKEFEKSQRQ